MGRRQTDASSFYIFGLKEMNCKYTQEIVVECQT